MEDRVYLKSQRSVNVEDAQFQLDLLIVVLLNTLHNYKDWRISSDNIAAGKFGNIVLELADRSFLLQRKFRKTKKITSAQLFSCGSNNADFSLAKFFFSYLEIKSEFKDKTVIVCTNADVNPKCLKEVFVHHKTEEDSLLHCQGAPCLFFTLNENVMTDLKASVERYFDENLQSKSIDKAVITDKNLKEFSNNLQFFCNYPTGDKLHNIIEQLMSRLGETWCKTSYYEIYLAIGDWYMQPNSEYLTEFRSNVMLCEIRSDKYCESLKDLNLLFASNDLEITKLRRINFVKFDKQYLWPILKIYQSLRWYEHRLLFVNPKDPIKVQKAAVETFGFPRYMFLILVWTAIKYETIKKEIIIKLRRMLETIENKKIILIVNDDTELAQQFGVEDIGFINGSVTFQDLSKNSQGRLLNTKNLYFQGGRISLDELSNMQDHKNITKSVDSIALERRVGEKEKVKVGEGPTDLDEYTVQYGKHIAASAKKTKDAYEKREGSAGMEGVQFQLDLLIVILLNTLRNHKDWRISSDNIAAGKLDDIVLELPDRTFFLQTKFKRTKKITFAQLFSQDLKNADFSLAKYFFSYLEIKSNFKENTIIICTSMSINPKGLENVLVRHNSEDNNLLQCEGASCSFFTLNENVLTDLKASAESYFDKKLQGKGIDKAVITDKCLREFLENLQFFCNYPSGDELHKIIEQLMSRLGDPWCKTSYHQIYWKIVDWFNQRKGEYLTEFRSKAMLCEIRSDKYCDMLKDLNVSFNSKNLYIKRSRIVFVKIDREYLLAILKIYHSLQGDRSRTLFVNPDDPGELQREAVDVFTLHRYTSLIIVSTTIDDETAKRRIINKLREILKKDEYKKVILLVSDDIELPQQFGVEDFCFIDGSVTFHDLSKDSQERLLKTKNVNFQGDRVSLEELLNTQGAEDYTKSLDTNMLERLVREEEVKVGTRVPDLDLDISPYYVNRKFQMIGYEISKEKCILTEQNIFCIKEKVVVISDDAGMGKTIVLGKIAVTIKKSNSSLWVVKININDCMPVFRYFVKIKRNKITAEELLNSLEEFKLTDQFEKLVFSMTGKIVLLLDGVDEVSPDCRPLVHSLLTHCQEARNFAKIFVTTRPHVDLQLKEVGLFKLLPYNKEEQVDFLTHYWIHNLNVTDENGKEKGKQYATILIEEISSWAISDMPLHLKFLAETFQENIKGKKNTAWESCREYLMSDNDEPKLREKIRIAKLCDTFIKKKLDMFIDKETLSGDNQFESWLDYHRSLAVNILLPKYQQLFKTQISEDKNKEEYILRIGIMKNIRGNRRFIHETFAEYFLADSIIRQFRCPNPDPDFGKLLTDKILKNDEFEKVRVIIDDLLDTFSTPTLDLDEDTVHTNGNSSIKRTDGCYKEGRDNGGIGGLQFQLDLLIVLLLNALRNHEDWRISSQNQKAGKFCDIVFEHPGKNVFLQHKFEQTMEINPEQIFSCNSNNTHFSLPHYFFDYQKIKSNFKEGTMIICTNAEVTKKGLENVLVHHNAKGDSLLYCEDTDCSFFTLSFKEKFLNHLKKSTKVYCEKNLKCVAKAVITDENLKNFLRNFQFFYGYPNGDELHKIIEQLLSQLGGLWCKLSYHEIYRKVENWYIQPTGEYLTEFRSNAMLCEIRSDKYCELLKGFNVSFDSNDLNIERLKGFSLVKSNEEYLLTILKIYHSLWMHESRALFVNPEDPRELRTQAVDAFSLRHYTYVIMIWAAIETETARKEIISKLTKILEKDNYKKVVLVVSGDTKWAQQFGLEDICFIDGFVTFHDLSKDCKERLLKTKNVLFQGRRVSLEELLNTQAAEDFTKSLNSTVLERLIREEEVKVGVRLPDLDEDIARYYVNRRFNVIDSTTSKNEYILTEQHLYYSKEKVIVISDNAGTGKSIVLAKIAATIKKNNPSLWVMRINLSDYARALSTFMKNNKNILNAVELLHSVEATKMNDLEELVFSINKKVVLMLDGVDEISPNYTNLVLSLLHDCEEASNIAKIFVTTRPHVDLKLEQVGLFKLLPLSEMEQVNFLTDYWMYNLQLTDKDEEKCKQYATILIEKVSSWAISDIPLHLKFLAELFQGNIEHGKDEDYESSTEFLESGRNEPKLPKKFNIAKLCRIFIEKKRDIFIDKENPSGDIQLTSLLLNQFESWLDYHRSLAINTLLPKDKQEFEYNIPKDNHTEEYILSIGIVQNLSVNDMPFINKTFAEYFLADSMLRDFKVKYPNRKYQELLTSTQLNGDQFKDVRAIISDLIDTFSTPTN